MPNQDYHVVEIQEIEHDFRSCIEIGVASKAFASSRIAAAAGRGLRYTAAEAQTTGSEAQTSGSNAATPGVARRQERRGERVPNGVTSGAEARLQQNSLHRTRPRHKNSQLTVGFPEIARKPPDCSIDQIDMDLARGLHSRDAVIDAPTHRLRPIVLTAVAASVGMIPIASEVFWGPMAYAIIGGMLVATLLTLPFLPALYVAGFRIREPRKEQPVRVTEAASGAAL